MVKKKQKCDICQEEHNKEDLRLIRIREEEEECSYQGSVCENCLENRFE